MAQRRQTRAVSSITKQGAYDPRDIIQNIVDTPLQEEMTSSFLAYAYSVIYARALPDARDGVKPVQRRIIYQMGQMHLTPDKPYMKSARVVGEVMGKLHPHGDSAIYEAMVRLAQPFSLRLPLVDGHGNFGSLDDGPAASRYTEVRLAPAALGMNADIQEETVPFVANYDNKLMEPSVLPAEIPNLLVNGSTGIAVGMATNMPTHNLGEVIAGARYLLRHPDATLDDLMKYIPGPDLPTGGIILGYSGIRDAYETGRGSFTMRAQAHIEKNGARKNSIVVTELPFGIGPEKVLERIAASIKDKKLEGISHAVDLSDRHNGLRLVIGLKAGFDPQIVLGQLYRRTPMEETFTINNVALVDGRPHTLGLKELLQVWIDHRRLVIRNRSEFRKKKSSDRLHLVNGLLRALIDIDKVIAVIRNSDNQEIARQEIMTVFNLDEIQTNYILDLQLRRLTKMSRIELENEKEDLLKRIKELEALLSSSQLLDDEVARIMDSTAAQWADSRRSILLNPQEEEKTISQQQLIEKEKSADLRLKEEKCTILLSRSGRIGRISQDSNFIKNVSIEKNIRTSYDDICAFIDTTTSSRCALITTAGRCISVSVADISSVKLMEDSLGLSMGVSVQEYIENTTNTSPVAGERVLTLISLDSGSRSDDSASLSIAMATRKGNVKRWNFEAPTTMDSWNIINLEEDDVLIGASYAYDTSRLVFISSDGQLLTYDAAKVRPQGRNAAGMIGMQLKENADVIAFGVIDPNAISWDKDSQDVSNISKAVIATCAQKRDALPGMNYVSAKVTPLSEFPIKGRGTQGVRAQRLLKGENRLLCAGIGVYPLYAVDSKGAPVELPSPCLKRDASGEDIKGTPRFIV